ncbi:unnamed protein product [Lactuca saligna]|uniref:Uncharacterized protein n=1 Tax=Lactuca saligna TaxID=75948 RepID=A0AA35ZL06_LACSI|nr:unnamed protein product [Lactuca saligna]
MGLLNPNQRPSRGIPLDSHIPSTSSSNSSSTSSSLTNTHNSRKKWSNLLPVFLVLVFIAEISFLGRLDLIKNADLLNSWTESFYQFTTASFSSSSLDTADEVSMFGLSDAALDVLDSGDVGESCEEWLEREDSVEYSRDFKSEPVFVTGGEQEWKSCAVNCKFGFEQKKADAAFGLPNGGGTAGVLRSMESAQYYAENNIAMARRWERV